MPREVKEPGDAADWLSYASSDLIVSVDVARKVFDWADQMVEE